MVEPKFEIGSGFTGKELISYKVTFQKNIWGGDGKWKVEGECTSGSFSVSYERTEQHLKHCGAKCLNYREVTF